MLFFTSVYELVGAEIDGYYKHFDDLTKFSKALVKKWKEEFYKRAKEGLEPNFTTGSNGQIPLEFGSAKVNLPTDNDPIATEQDGKSVDNICSTSDAYVDETDVSGNIPTDLHMEERCIPNQEKPSSMVLSLSNYVDQDSVQGGDSTVWDENQVSSVPESSHMDDGSDYMMLFLRSAGSNPLPVR